MNKNDFIKVSMCGQQWQVRQFVRRDGSSFICRSINSNKATGRITYSPAAVEIAWNYGVANV